jgi:hypothetical protein
LTVFLFNTNLYHCQVCVYKYLFSKFDKLGKVLTFVNWDRPNYLLGTF